MELQTFEVKTAKSRLLPMEETLIIPISDLQYGSTGCDLDRFERLIKWGVKNNAYYIGLGDMVDFASPSNRSTIRSNKESGYLYDSTVDILDQGADKALETVKNILKPTKGRWLGMLQGHHYYIFADGTTSDTRLCQFLECPFLGDSAFVQVRFKPKKENKYKAPAFTIMAYHGAGGGGTQAAPLNKLEQLMKAFDADVYLTGHHHKKTTCKAQRIVPEFGNGKARLLHKNVILACTGSYLKGYEVGSQRDGRAQGGYVERAMMNPVALGSVALWARPRYVNNGYATVDLDISL